MRPRSWSVAITLVLGFVPACALLDMAVSLLFPHFDPARGLNGAPIARLSLCGATRRAGKRRVRAVNCRGHAAGGKSAVKAWRLRSPPSRAIARAAGAWRSSCIPSASATLQRGLYPHAQRLGKRADAGDQPQAGLSAGARVAGLRLDGVIRSTMALALRTRHL